MVNRSELECYLHEYLNADSIQDYCPNGLQVQGRDEIHRIVCGVTASQRFLKYAVAQKADAVLVHHGFFWKNEELVITKEKYQRVSLLIENKINLLAYHLPLDKHKLLGNNVQLAKYMNWITTRLSMNDLLYIGRLPMPMTVLELSSTLEKNLNRLPMILGESSRLIESIAWCTGAAQSFFPEAVRERVDAYITGEVSESNYHLAMESGVLFVAAGHHATERYGVQALCQHIQDQFGCSWEYYDEANPV